MSLMTELRVNVSQHGVHKHKCNNGVEPLAFVCGSLLLPQAGLGFGHPGMQ